MIEKQSSKQIIFESEPSRKLYDNFSENNPIFKYENRKRFLLTNKQKEEKPKKTKTQILEFKFDRPLKKKKVFTQTISSKVGDDLFKLKTQKDTPEKDIIDREMNETIYGNNHKIKKSQNSKQIFTQSSKNFAEHLKIDFDSNLSQIYSGLYCQNFGGNSESIEIQRFSKEPPVKTLFKISDSTAKLSKQNMTRRSSQNLKTTSELVNNIVDEVQINLQKVFVNLKDLDSTLSSKDRSDSRKNRSQSLNRILERQRAKKLEKDSEQNISVRDNIKSSQFDLYSFQPAKTTNFKTNEKNNIILETEEKEDRGNDYDSGTRFSKIASHSNLIQEEKEKLVPISALFDKLKMDAENCKEKFLEQSRTFNLRKIESSSLETKNKAVAQLESEKNPKMVKRGNQSELVCEQRYKSKVPARASGLNAKKIIVPIGSKDVSPDKITNLKKMKMDFSLRMEFPLQTGSNSPKKEIKRFVENSHYHKKMEDLKKSNIFGKFKSQKNYLKNLSNMLKSMTKKENPSNVLKLSAVIDKKNIEIGEEIDKKNFVCGINSFGKLKTFKQTVFLEKNKTSGTHGKSLVSGFSYQKKLFPNSTKIVNN